MAFFRFSLRTTVAILFAALSMALVVLSWEIYRDFSIDSQKRSLEEFISMEIQRVVQQLEEAAEEIGMYTQHQQKFREAFRNNNRPGMAAVLDDQFRQFRITLGNIKLAQLYAYDDKFNLVSWSTEGPAPKNKAEHICRESIHKAQQRQGAARLQLFSGLCQWNDRAYHSMIVPVGGLRHSGYLQVIINPVYSLLSIEKSLGMPIMLVSKNNSVIYRSSSWHAQRKQNEIIEASYWLYDDVGTPLTMLSVERDLSDFMTNEAIVRNRLMLLAGGVTLIMVLVAFWLLHKSMFTPIRQLIDQLYRVRQDRHALNSPIKIQGNVEIRRLVEAFNEIGADLSQLYDKYEELAFKDQLTSLPNRALFLDRLKQMILLSHRKEEQFGVMLLDLDGFKEVNDTLGHRVGDELLKEIALRLQRIIRASSTVARVSDENNPLEHETIIPENEEMTVARLGGDEFAILLPNLQSVEGAVAVAKRVADVLEPAVDVDGDKSIVVAGTLGIAMYPDHASDAEDLLRCADIALYVAKNVHEDFSIYDAAYDNHSIEQLSLKAELRTAIDENQLVLYYQPKLNFKTGCVTGVEALVRWEHPERGLIPPVQFIPLAEQRGLIGPLTDWVIERALQQYKVWESQGIYLQIAVNLSSRVLYDLSLPNKVERALIRSALSPASLSLEITEEATMIDPKRALDVLNRLDEMGISLSIDDFGTGYSSLGYLKRLPVEEIKIDRSFVMDMDQSENDAKIVHATVDLAHNLGLRVVAEGVESEVTLNMLKALNCDYAQGFYLSRPVPPDELIKWLQESGWECEIYNNDNRLY